MHPDKITRFVDVGDAPSEFQVDSFIVEVVRVR
jgi:hypothetical protein